jgi:hypothetical protein
MFPVGFTYTIGDITYEVIEKSSVDNTEFRKLKTSDGRTEHLSVESILRDLREQPPNIKIAIDKDPNRPEKENEKA